MTENPLPIDYSPLAPTGEIRILVLGRGSSSDPIQCTLLHSTHGEMEYQALSYEWGDEKENDPSIAVNGQSVQIRNNLYEAMSHIRESSEELYLWVDALCINQADLQEKNRQVAMMGEIFASATQVIAWLGVASDGSDTAMDWMTNKDILKKRLSRCPPDSPERKAVVELCSRSYWRRVWIIQELYLSQDYVVNCGTKSMPRDAFAGSLAALNEPQFEDWKAIQNNSADGHRWARQLRDAGLTHVNRLFRWLRLCIQRDYQSSRGHDFIYSLIGISDDCKGGEIVIDYERPIREVFLDVLRVDVSRWRDRDGGAKWHIARKMGLQIDERLELAVKEVLE
ncbi:hypothetical protein FZEAL_5021 [Fusarium zealandicum]|uniref:Heterokaryon incompatibility domain-containing protein n=1 Tax=Fusarium zealandicum TaxID=1053134 RepID=A0A8H4XL06_9HYPO|nr:hypothetical protein FZEAL_5021 [Fusarium zealandicum]